VQSLHQGTPMKNQTAGVGLRSQVVVGDGVERFGEYVAGNDQEAVSCGDGQDEGTGSGARVGEHVRAGGYRNNPMVWII